MFRSASRTALRHASVTSRQLRLQQPRRFASSQTSKPRSWKSIAVRVGLAAGAVYYYQNSSVFAEEPSLSLQLTPPRQDTENDSLPTVESVATARKRKAASSSSSSQPSAPKQQPAPAASESAAAASAAEVEIAPTESQPLQLTPGELEEEADQQGAFNPETGEINWDCPCLGGMAHGPCGEEFRSAFSCFVYSTEEPKGMDCIDKFKGMQDCFRLHPDVYGSQLDEDELDEQVSKQAGETEADIPAERIEKKDEEPAQENKPLPDPRAVQHEAERELDTPKTLRAPQPWHDASEKNGEAEKETKK